MISLIISQLNLKQSAAHFCSCYRIRDDFLTMSNHPTITLSKSSCSVIHQWPQFNDKLNQNFSTVCLRSQLLLTKENVSFINVLLKTDCSFGLDSTVRSIWIKSLNSEAQHCADTLHHPLCAVIYFLQHNWSSHRWCHQNTRLSFRIRFVAPRRDRADQLHWADSNKCVCWADWQVFDIQWHLQSTPHICLSGPQKGMSDWVWLTMRLGTF